MKKSIITLVLMAVILVVSDNTSLALSTTDINPQEIGNTISRYQYEQMQGVTEKQLIQTYLDTSGRQTVINRIEPDGRYFTDIYTSESTWEEFNKNKILSIVSENSYDIYEVYGLIPEERFEEVKDYPNFLCAYNIITGIQDINLKYPECFDTITKTEIKEIGKESIVLVHITFNKYSILEGDTLSEIAVKYGTTVEELAKINKIQNPDLIYAGEYLFLR